MLEQREDTGAIDVEMDPVDLARVSDVIHRQGQRCGCYPRLLSSCEALLTCQEGGPAAAGDRLPRCPSSCRC